MEPTMDPSELGFEPSRLSRIDKHLAGYVDDGRLASWEVAPTRGEHIAHVLGSPEGSIGVWRPEIGRSCSWGENLLEIRRPATSNTSHVLVGRASDMNLRTLPRSLSWRR